MVGVKGWWGSRVGGSQGGSGGLGGGGVKG